ncbi:hypothetical protein QE392_002578 [Microbacterium proteolyticum]|nr:hypothetical protein [Microbacterium sp. SORGH_AS_0344]MDQ1170774.1 hypothetical protein [Microbacterium proteolyticum]
MPRIKLTREQPQHQTGAVPHASRAFPQAGFSSPGTARSPISLRSQRRRCEVQAAPRRQCRRPPRAAGSGTPVARRDPPAPELPPPAASRRLRNSRRGPPAPEPPPPGAGRRPPAAASSRRSPTSGARGSRAPGARSRAGHVEREPRAAGAPRAVRGSRVIRKDGALRGFPARLPRTHARSSQPPRGSLRGSRRPASQTPQPRCATRAFRRRSVSSLPSSSIDSNSGGDTRRPVSATRGGP